MVFLLVPQASDETNYRALCKQNKLLAEMKCKNVYPPNSD